MVQLVYDKKSANCITHSGTMHADEVFATAFLELFLGDVKVFRTPSINIDELDENVLVYDIGRGEFDHHQNDREIRQNNIPYSSIGLLWKKFGKSYLASCNYDDIDLIFNEIDKDLIEAIDADDNGIFPKIDANYRVKTLSNIIKIFNPSFGTNQDEGEQFLKAVNLAKIIFEEEILNIVGKINANKKLNTKLEEIKTDSKYLVLDEFIPYEDTLLKDENNNNILFVAYPSNRGGYAIKTVPKSLEDKTAKCSFPEEWAGLEGKELEKVSGIKGLVFCHSGRFIVSCKDKECVYEVLNKMCK